MEVTIELCGQLAVSVDGRRREAELPGRQGRLAVAYLALHRAQPVSRDGLVTALWGDDAPGHAQALNVVLSKLRRALGAGTLETTGERAAVRGRRAGGPGRGGGGVRGARGARERRLGDGHGRGQPRCRDCRPGLLPGYDAPWLEEPRRRLEELGLQARELRGDAGLALGGAELAPPSAAAQELVERAPFRESGYLLLMRVREAQGNVVEALRVHDRLRTLLRDELGVAPGPQVQAEFDGCCGPSSARPTPHRPAPAPSRPRRRARGAPRSSRPAAARLRRPPQRARAPARATSSGPPAAAASSCCSRASPGSARRGWRSSSWPSARRPARSRSTAAAMPRGSSPYQPFVEALRRYVARESPDRLAPWTAPSSAASCPSWRDGDTPPRRRRPSATGCSRRSSEVLVGIARSQPVVLVLDDLHWADKPTLLMLRQLVRSADDAPVLIVASFRDTERPAALIDILVQLRREHYFERIGLRGLDEADAAELIERVRAGRHARARQPRAVGGDQGQPVLPRGDGPAPREPARERAAGRRAVADRAAGGDPRGHRAAAGDAVRADRAVLDARGGDRARVPIELLEALGPTTRTSSTRSSRRASRAGDRRGARRLRPLQLHAQPDPTDALRRAHRDPPRAAAPAGRRSARGAGGRTADRRWPSSPTTSSSRRRSAGRRRPSTTPSAPPSRRPNCSPTRRRRGCTRSRCGRSSTRRRRPAAPLRAAARMRRRADQGRRGRRRARDVPRGGDARARSARRRAARAGRARLRRGGQMAGGVVDDDGRAAARRGARRGRRAGRGAARAPARPAGDGAELLRGSASGAPSSAPRRSRSRAASATRAALGIALVARHWSLWGPTTSRSACEAANELLGLAERTGDERLAMQGHRWRMIDLLELGDIGRGRRRDRRLRADRRAPPRLSDELVRAVLAGDAAAPRRRLRRRPRRRGPEAARVGERMQDTNTGKATLLQSWCCGASAAASSGSRDR